MIVDDEADIRKSIKKVLESEGYKVVTAMTADDCARKVVTEEPDLIVMDVMMPGTPPKEILPQISDYRVVFLSIVRKEDAKKEGLLEYKNVVDYIQKPFDIKKLAARVKKILGE